MLELLARCDGSAAAQKRIIDGFEAQLTTLRGLARGDVPDGRLVARRCGSSTAQVRAPTSVRCKEARRPSSLKNRSTCRL